MESMKGAASFRNPGKQSFLPPKSPSPNLASLVHGDYGLSESKGTAKPRDGFRHHQRTSSESVLIEEQPSWLDDLLNEPDTPARRGAHRRSSSDSFAYFEGAYVYTNMDNLAQEECKRTLTTMPSWGSQELDALKGVRHSYEGNLFAGNSFDKQKNRVWESAFNMGSYPNNFLPAKEKGMHQGSSGMIPKEPELLASCAAEKYEEDGYLKDSKTCLEKMETSQAKQSQPDSDTKRVKQQFAQRSRVRKLQYIAELERTVQGLQAEALEVSAELEFLDQQNIILNLENKALKQRLDSVAQEHLVKRLQQEMLEREIARLRLIFQQQQQPPPPQATPSHGRKSSRDLDSHFNHLSLKHKEASSS
ncbi:hypothetical protein HPP92_004486 [Vanilla planifolia]|uniref:BZIP domain-containing protein n=1 Tax=Vanilla planifolia TaxID=51239 RepID=A0A835VJX8_VANPL|nr:hypothetical protein HPP92_004486 [Vanilla planifolia]